MKCMENTFKERKRNKTYHHIAPSRRAQGGEGPLQDQIRAQTRGRQAHNWGKITSTSCKTILGQVISLPRDHPLKMEEVEPSQGVGTPQASPTIPISCGLPHTAFPRSIAKVSSRFNVPRGQFGTFHIGINTTIDWLITIAIFIVVAIEATMLCFHRWLDR
jgi:hypothetical protein